MTPIILLDKLESFISEKLSELRLPCKDKDNDNAMRRLNLFKMRVPSKHSQSENAPYILLQLINGSDDLQGGDSVCKLRLVVLIYDENESEGAMNLLNVITALRTELLKAGVIDDCFLLKPPLEYLLYTEDTSPYFVGEMMTVWELPAVKREVMLY